MGKHQFPSYLTFVLQKLLFRNIESSHFTAHNESTLIHTIQMSTQLV